MLFVSVVQPVKGCSIKFKFNNTLVIVENGEITCQDPAYRMILAAIIKSASSGPEEGDPVVNSIQSVFGADSVTDIEYDDDSLIY